MAELITVTSSKGGIGKTTFAAIIATLLDEKGKKSLILTNSNNTDTKEILMVDTEIDSSDIKPYIIAESLDKKIIDGVKVRVTKGIDVISNSTYGDPQLDLSSEDIIEIKNVVGSDYDYIIVDLDFNVAKDAGVVELLRKSDKTIVITNGNKLNTTRAKVQMENVTKEDRKDLKDIISRSLVVYNGDKPVKEAEKSSFYTNKDQGLYVHVSNSTSIKEFTNGFKLDLDKENQDSINSIMKFITEEQVEVKESLLGRLFKGVRRK